MDYALAVDLLLPAADFRRADDYAALVATWHDARPVPSDAALVAAWEGYAAQQASLAAMASAREAMIAIFQALPIDLRKAYYPLRAGLQVALDEGDLAAARGAIEDLDPSTPEESAFRTNLLSLLPE